MTYTDERKLVENLDHLDQYDFKDTDKHYIFRTQKGLNEDVIRQISAMKGEPDWMLDFRLKAYRHFMKRPMPNWGADLSGLDLNDIYFYVRPTEGQGATWDEVA